MVALGPMVDRSWEQIKHFGAWQEARDFLRSLEGRYVFRGMSEADWYLETTLDRRPVRPGACGIRYRPGESEAILTDSFRRALPASIREPPPSEDILSWLALMRHYGLPSRLLDCTESPFIAAYFASKPPERACSFAIWAIKKDDLQLWAEESLGILSSCSAHLSPGELGTPDLFAVAFSNTTRSVALADAKHKTRRQIAQRALFLCPGDPGYPFWRNLHGVPPESRTSDSMYKVVLPCVTRSEVLSDLRAMDVDQPHLLPDRGEVDELCAKLQYLLEQSQKNHSHFEWKVVVKPILEKHGLLNVELPDCQTH